MADGVNYDVNAILRTSGSFEREANLAAKAGDTLGSSWSRMGDKLVSVGERVRGTFGGLAKDLTVGGALAVGGGLVAGIGAATAKGIEFNNTMEQGALNIATMYQTFGVNPAFDKNIQLAQAMQNELVKIADASPGTTADIMTAYQALAPGVTGVTQDLMRQRDLMESIAVLGGITGGDYKQLGMDVSRIVKGLAGADVMTFSTLQPAIEEAFKEVTGKKIGADFAAQFNKVARANGETALTIFETAINKMGPDVNKTFGESFGGVLASVESKMLKLAGDFGKPLFDGMRDSMNKMMAEGGALGEASFGKLREIAFFSGGVLADAFDRGARLLMRGVDYVVNNWESLAEQIRNAGVAAGAAIQGAIVVGISRHLIGSSLIAAGKISSAFDTAKSTLGVVAERIKTTHIGLARGMKGGGKGVTGAIGRGMGAVLGREKGAGFNRFGLDKPMLQIASLVTTIGGLGLASAAVVGAVGAIGVAIGGVTAWFMSKWDEIAGSLIRGLEDGSISLVPLITSLYTFYLRLQLVGEALMGTTTAADIAGGGINLLTTAIDVATSVLSPFIYALGVLVGAWGILKVALLGVMGVIYGFVKLGNTLGAISDATLARAESNMTEFAEGTSDTFKKSQELFKAAGAIADAQLSPLEFEAAKEKAKQLEQSLADAIKGTGTAAGEAGKGGRAKKPAVKIDKVEVVVDVKDPDPDRIFAQILPKWTDLADKRVQAYESLDVGS